MDVVFVLGAYVLIALLCNVPFTRHTYKDSLMKNKNPLPEIKSNGKPYTKAERDELETQRRKKLAAEALRSGFVLSALWIVVVPAFVIFFVIALTMKGVHAISIKPEDRQFISEKEFRKAEAIVEQWKLQEKQDFEKELGE